MSYTPDQVREALQVGRAYLPINDGTTTTNEILRWLAENYAGMAKDAARLDWVLDWLGMNDSDLPVRDWDDNQDARSAIDEATIEALREDKPNG
jgi:hypothetical protein